MISNTHFTEFLQDIEPSATTKSQVRTAHEAIRTFLRDHPTFGQRHVETFLSGSYKRDTSVRPRLRNGKLDRPDVDIIVITNHVPDDDPEAVVQELHRAIDDGYDYTERQSRSVGVTAPNGVDMDVVPLIEPYGDGGGYLIPDRDLKIWLPTNPTEHTAWTTRVNEAAAGRFKPLVKLMKWWRRHNPTTGRHPKGFVLECMSAECMDYSELHYGLLFVRTLEGIVSRYEPLIELGIVPHIPDPGVPGNSVTSNISYKDFRSAYDRVVLHAEIGRRALAEEDLEEMTRLWREIFGPRFPATKTAKGAGLLGAAVSPSSLIFPDRPVQPRKPAGFA